MIVGGRWTEQEKEGGGACEHRELTSELGERSGRPENERRRRNGPGGGAADAGGRGRVRRLQATPAQSHAPGGRGARGRAGGGVSGPRGGRSPREVRRPESGVAAVRGLELGFPA